MSWIKDMFGTKAKKQQATAEMRRYANSIVTSIFRQTFNNYSHESPIYDLQSPEKVLEESILSNTDVLGVVSKIYGMAQNATLRIYQEKNGKLEAYEGKNLDYYKRFLDKPSRQMDFSEFLQQYFNFICTVGNSFWSIVRYDAGAMKGMTSELVAMYSQYVNVVTTGDYVYPIKGYEYYWNPDRKDILSYEDVIHIKWANPKYVYGGQYFGLSPMKVAQRIVQKQNSIVKREGAQIQNGGPQKAAFIDGDGDDGSIASGLQQEQFKESMDAYIRDARGDTPLLPQKIGVVDLQKSTKDMGLIESSQDGLRAICRVLSFPSQLLNDNSASTYNNVSEARKSAWTDCIIRHLSVFEKKFTEAIITKEDRQNGVCYKWDYSAIPELAGDLNKIVDALTKAKATPNELRERVGLPRINESAMDEPYFSSNDLALRDMGIEDDNIAG